MTHCEQVPAFADGELPPNEADAFRAHLAGCERCVAELFTILQLQGLAAEPVSQAPAASASQPRARLRPLERKLRPTNWKRVVAGSAILAAALVAVLVWKMPRLFRLSHEAQPLLALAPTRSMEGRLSHSPWTAYRPYAVTRSGQGQSREMIPLRTLATLEDADDYLGLAEAHLMRGEPAQAEAALEHLPKSAATQNDRALIALQRKRAEEALALVTESIRLEPRSPSAQWNRSLILRQLGLPLLASESLDQVAALGERGWSDEAQERARALRELSLGQSQAWRELWKDGSGWVEAGKTPDVTKAKRFPGLSRLLFYDALRCADTPSRAQNLLELATSLDDGTGGHTLKDEVRRVLKSDFTARAPLAQSYLRLWHGVMDAQEADVFLSSLRRAKQPDILLGALFLLQRVDDEKALYQHETQQLEDPWFEALLAHESARRRMESGEFGRAEALLSKALKSCNSRHIAYRCAELESDMAWLALQEQRLQDARAHTANGLRLATDLGEFGLESEFLGLLANEARLRNAFPLAEAYLHETELREPEDCAVRRSVHEQVAAIKVFALSFGEAQQEIHRAASCGEPLSLWGLSTLTDVYGALRQSSDAEQVRRALQTQSKVPNASALQQLHVQEIEGELDLLEGKGGGETRLKDVITRTSRLPVEDEDSRKVRSAAYSALIFEAARREDAALSLELFAQERSASLPKHCVLALAGRDGAVALSGLDAAGRLFALAPFTPKASLSEVAGVVPNAVIASLRACDEVAVFARFPFQGLPGLLPDDFAWSYRLRDTPKVPAAARNALLVADIPNPPELELPQLNAFSSAERAHFDTRLSGPEATPSRVLTQMRDASEITIEAHGLSNEASPDASLIVLAEDASGEFALTAGAVRRNTLARHPFVILGACEAGETAPFLHHPNSLPEAFLEAGASSVLASRADLPDHQVGLFLDAVRLGVRAGRAPAVALQKARAQWKHSEWALSFVIFD